jgi:hypothetical protein
MRKRKIPKNLDRTALEAMLRRALYRADCPTTMELGDYQMGLLPGARRANIQSHVRRCRHCQAELSRLVNFLAEAPAAAHEPDPSWLEMTLEYGRAWLDSQTGHWRQVWLSLSSLGGGLEQAPALAGIMGTEKASEPRPAAIHVARPDAGFEIKVTVKPEPQVGDEERCRLDVDVALKERFGDFSGVRVALLHEGQVDSQVTNSQGEVSFGGFPCGRLPMMSLVVIPPS